MAEPMSNVPQHKEVIDESRASFLLGLPQDQLREICELSGLGHSQTGTETEQLLFTYEDLHKLCRLLVGPTS
jgi:hypothetical protein